MGLQVFVDIFKALKGESALDALKDVKYVAEAAGLRGGDKFLEKLGPAGESMSKALKASFIERYADRGGVWQSRFFSEVVPHSADAARDEAMYKSLIELAENKAVVSRGGELVELTGPELRTHLMNQWQKVKPADYSRWPNAWEELQTRLTRYKELDKEVFDEATNAAGIPVVAIENHYPHVWRAEDITRSEFWERYLEDLAEERGFRTSTGELDTARAEKYFNQQIAPNRHFVAESLERPRITNRTDYNRTPLGYLEYLDNSARRIAEVKHFGPNYERVTAPNGWLATIEASHGKTARDLAEQMFDNLTGRYTTTKAFKRFSDMFLTPARQLAAFRLRPLTTLRNLNQSQFAIYATDVESFAKGMKKYLTNTKEIQQFAYESRAIHLGDKIENTTWIGKIAQRGQATFWQGELGAFEGNRFMQAAVNWHYKNIGMLASERMVRSISAEAGRQYLFELFAKAKKGDKYAVRAMRELIDIADEPSLTERLLQLPTNNLEKYLNTATDDALEIASKAQRRAAWNVVDDTQFGLSGRMKLPIFWQGPIGRFLFQFKTFSYRSMQFWYRTAKRDVMQNKGRGLIKILPAMASLWAPGVGFQYLFHWLYSSEDPNQPLWMPDKLWDIWEPMWRNVIEPLTIMGVTDLFFDLSQDLLRNGSVTRTMEQFASPVGWQTLKRMGTAAGMAKKKAAEAMEWKEIDRLWKMSPKEAGKVITSIPLPSVINVGPLFVRKLLNDKQERQDEIERYYRRFYGGPPRISPRRRMRQMRRRLERQR